MLVQEIFDSKAKIKILDKIIDSDGSFSVIELSRLSNTPKSTVSLIVKDWDKAGLISTQKVGQTKIVHVNKKFSLYSSVKKLFSDKEKIAQDTIIKIKKSSLFRSKDAVCIIVFGSLARKDFSSKSDADMLVVTEKLIIEDKVLDKLWGDLYGNLDFVPSCIFLSKKQVMERLKQKDKFIFNVFTQGIPLKGREWFESTKRAL